MPFTLFSTLPTELRLKIWALSLPGRRIVALNYTCAPANGSHETPHEHNKRGCTSPTPIPSILHANRESRNEALLSYNLSFSILHGCAKVFFNPNLDVMYFGPRQGYLNSFKQFANACTMIKKDEMVKIERLAVHADLFSQSNEHVSATRILDFWECVQRKFTNLKELVVVSKSGRECCVGGGLCEIEMEILWRKIETGRDAVRRGKEWQVPKWCVVTLEGEAIDGLRWPQEVFSEGNPNAKREDVVGTSYGDVFGMAALRDIL